MKTRIVFLTAVAVLILMVLAACNLPIPTNQSASSTDNNTNSDNTKDAVSTTDSGNDQNSEEDQPEDLPDFLGKQDCEEISVEMAHFFPLNIVITQESFAAENSGLGGPGCRVYTSGDGTEVTDWSNQVSGLLNAISAAGWQSDVEFSAGGAGGELLTYRRAGIVCQLVTEVKPADSGLCGQEALAACLAELPPAQILYEVTLRCTPDGSGEDDTSEEEQPPERERIVFEAGAISAYRHGSLPATHSFAYVLRAEAGQQMVVTLNTTPPLSGLFSIHGEDGTVLISDHGDTMYWYGDLPVTQDYIITLRAHPDYGVDYTLGVIIPPQGETFIGSYTPMPYDQCRPLADQIGGVLGVEAFVSTALFEDPIAQNTGSGCLITAWGDGLQFPDWGTSTSAVMAAVESLGWVEDQMYAAGGAGGLATAYRKDGNLCIYVQTIREISRDLCPSNQPVSACWANLAPEQMIYTITMNCAIP